MKKLGTFLALAAVMASAPVFAGKKDMAYYEQNRGLFISEEKAAEIARGEVKEGRVSKVEFERGYNNDHRFEVEVEKEGMWRTEYKVIIDAQSGKVIRTERD